MTALSGTPLPVDTSERAAQASGYPVVREAWSYEMGYRKERPKRADDSGLRSERLPRHNGTLLVARLSQLTLGLVRSRGRRRRSGGPECRLASRSSSSAAAPQSWWHSYSNSRAGSVLYCAGPRSSWCPRIAALSGRPHRVNPHPPPRGRVLLVAGLVVLGVAAVVALVADFANASVQTVTNDVARLETTTRWGPVPTLDAVLVVVVLVFALCTNAFLQLLSMVVKGLAWVLRELDISNRAWNTSDLPATCLLGAAESLAAFCLVIRLAA